MKSAGFKTTLVLLFLETTKCNWVKISHVPDATNTSHVASCGTLPEEARLCFENKPEHDDKLFERSVDRKGFFQFVRDIQGALTGLAHKSVRSKIHFLKEIKDNMMLRIEEQVGHLWQSPTNSPVKSREYHDDSYHLDFPSNEGALMTIGFLTFAVFLIKLVLKLINALKNKNNGNLMTTTIMPTALGRNNKQDVIEEESVRILRSIEEYNSR